MIEIIPAIDVLDGKCVRLAQGDYNRKKIYKKDPLDLAKEFEDHGIKRLHMVDLDGAASKHIVNYKVLERVATQTSLVIDFGGGIKSDDDLRIAFECGAQMVTGGSIAVSDSDLFKHWLQSFGADRIILGADAKDNKIAVNGWMEDSNIDLFDFLNDNIACGVKKVICTDIGCDGMLAGPSISLYKEIMQQHPSLYLIASGGVSGLADIEALQDAGVPAVVFGKALYEGLITLHDLRMFL